MFGMIPIQIIVYAVAAVLTFSAGWSVNGWRWEKKEQAQEIARQKAIKDQESANIVATDKIRKEKDAQINAINNQLADALIQLRSRTSRNDNKANDGQGGTGRSLFAEDAEFLIREAARADQIRTALDACYKQYDEVK
jgi:hypothetical protein